MNNIILTYNIIITYYVLSYTYIYKNKHFHWKLQGHVSERYMLFRSQYALPVSTTLLRRCFFVNPVLTTLPLGPYYVL